jgi:hypothetical protein
MKKLVLGFGLAGSLFFGSSVQAEETKQPYVCGPEYYQCFIKVGKGKVTFDVVGKKKGNGSDTEVTIGSHITPSGKWVSGSTPAPGTVEVTFTTNNPNPFLP